MVPLVPSLSEGHHLLPHQDPQAYKLQERKFLQTHRLSSAPHCPSPAPRRECLEGPRCNADEVAVETRQDGTLREAKCPMFLARQKRGVRDVDPPQDGR